MGNIYFRLHRSVEKRGNLGFEEGDVVSRSVGMEREIGRIS